MSKFQNIQIEELGPFERKNGTKVLAASFTGITGDGIEPRVNEISSSGNWVVSVGMLISKEGNKDIIEESLGVTLADNEYNNYSVSYQRFFLTEAEARAFAEQIPAGTQIVDRQVNVTVTEGNEGKQFINITHTDPFIQTGKFSNSQNNSSSGSKANLAEGAPF